MLGKIFFLFLLCSLPVWGTSTHTTELKEPPPLTEKQVKKSLADEKVMNRRLKRMMDKAEKVEQRRLRQRAREKK